MCAFKYSLILLLVINSDELLLIWITLVNATCHLIGIRLLTLQILTTRAGLAHVSMHHVLLVLKIVLFDMHLR